MSQALRTHTGCKLISERVLNTSNGVLSVKIYVGTEVGSKAKEILNYLTQLKMKQPNLNFYELLQATAEKYEVNINHEVTKEPAPNLKCNRKEVSAINLIITAKA
jgi:hypothetical protein